MLVSYEAIVSFGVSALISFLVSALVLIAWAARRGVFRQRTTPRSATLPAARSAPLLPMPTPTAPTAEDAVDTSPLTTEP